MHTPLYIESLSLSFPGKVCFSDFSAAIHPGSRIALIGQNGTGKSSLLKLLHGEIKPTQGSVNKPKELVIGYVPQQIHDTLSGAERFNAALTQALSQNPDVLLLDEPTNHLDRQMKKSLIRMLASFKGTLIIASHDESLLRAIPTEFWRLHEGTIQIITTSYDTLLENQEQKRQALLSQIKHLTKDQEQLTNTVQHEQKARAQRRKAYKDDNDRNLRERRKEHASKSFGSSQGKLNKKKKKLTQDLQKLSIPEVIKPTFTLHAPTKTKKHVITIQEGTCGYHTPLLTHINLIINTGERIAITGPNASGKSTLLKALIHDPTISTTGTWLTPNDKDIGYLDQHYSTLHDNDTVLETIEAVTDSWSSHERRKHLASFLFRTTDQVHTQVTHLSGGEKARLSLACIAGQNPSLLIIDEITNNLDRETKDHVLQVLTTYTGTLIVVSHDESFLNQLGLGRSIDCTTFK